MIILLFFVGFLSCFDIQLVILDLCCHFNFIFCYFFVILVWEMQKIAKKFPNLGNEMPRQCKKDFQFGKCKKPANHANKMIVCSQSHVFFDFPARLQIQAPAPDEKTTKKKENDNKMTKQMTAQNRNHKKMQNHMTKNDKTYIQQPSEFAGIFFS